MKTTGAITICVVAIVLGLALIVVGALPFMIGLHDVTISGMQLGPEEIDRLKSQPGGQTLLNCALASVALANQGAEAYNNLAKFSRGQSLTLVVAGGLLLATQAFLLHWLNGLRKGIGR